jgi:DNA (cytosine-5)-methyltransferase 1
MRYGSVCSGIEAATAAWHHMGWEPAFFSEIEKFPCAVLEHHYPEVPLHGDFTTIEQNQYGTIDLLVGGTPCQSFSVAGLRGGLDDDRGNLALEFCRLAQREQPRWIVWENVPGVLSSSGGRDFGSILGALEDLGYGLAYRVLDAQYFGVAQRRRRVFVVGYLGDWRPAAAVLFERHSMSGHPAPSREARKEAAAATATGTGSGGGRERPDLTRSQGGTTVVTPFDTAQITSPHNYSSPKDSDPCHPLAAGAHFPAIAFAQNTRDEVRIVGGDGQISGALAAQPGTKQTTYLAAFTDDGTARTLTARHDSSPCVDRGPDVVATGFNGDQSEKTRSMGEKEEQSPTLRAGATRHVSIGWSEELTASVELAGTLQRGGSGGRHDGVMVQPIGFYANEGTHGGGNPPAVAYALQDVRGLDKKQNGKGWSDEGVSYTVDTHATQGVAHTEPAAYAETGVFYGGQGAKAGGSGGRHDVVMVQPIGFYANEGTRGAGSNTNQPPTLKAHPACSNLAAVLTKSAVRRLTPVECERLQGFPDNFTAIPWRKKGAEDCPDGPRYKALGNSMAVPVMRWIGERIQFVDSFVSIL